MGSPYVDREAGRLDAIAGKPKPLEESPYYFEGFLRGLEEKEDKKRDK